MTPPFDMPPLFALLFGEDGRTHEVGALLHALEHATSEADVVAPPDTFIGSKAASVERGDAASPEIEALLHALEYVTSEEEAIAVATAFADQAVLASSNPVETLIRVLGAECATAVAEVAVATVADFEAATVATGGPITDSVADRIARKMVRRIIRRAERTVTRPPRGRDVGRVRIILMSRARRAPRRRAVRLSAVASAGDGPSPPERPPAFCGGLEHERARRHRVAIDLAGDALPASEVRR
ncbi:Hypothetical protein A7982_11567 [Minicystis rosea]|nr:Hypothetical protein A7982_11567 [Minicystis rosea]